MVRTGVFSIFILLAFLAVLPACKNSSPPEEQSTADTLQQTSVKIEYGIATDSFAVVKGKIRRNENLSEILLKHHIPYPVIDALSKKSKEVFDVRKLRAGKNYTVYCSKDSTQKAQCFVYETNASDYVVFDLRDSIQVYTGQKPIEVRTRKVSGVIHSSLYETMDNNDITPMLAMELAEILAWSIDFYRIQKGDWFKVVFEEKWVDDQFIGLGRVLALNFNHMGEDHYGFYFSYDDESGYFDEKAESLRKAFLKAPVKFSRISSGFNRNRYHPILKRVKPHLGTDYAAPHGTPIVAVGDGTVIKASYTGGNGNYVKIRHNSTYTTQYLHMSKFAKGIKKGARVKQGDVIGYVGSTGLATGPHVCFRFWKHGRQVNHRREKMPPSKPVDEKYMTDYKSLVEKYMQQLREIGLPA